MLVMLFLFILSVLVTVGWIALAALGLSRSRSSRWMRPTDHPALADAPTVAAVVPARNESEHIAMTLRSLIDQDYPHLSILVVDDQSNDGTGEVVRAFTAGRDRERHPIRLLSGTERPEGWVGKTWALHQGIEATDSEWVWMVDADLWLHPRALASALHEASESRADLVSLLGRPRCRSFWQGTIAAALLLILFLLYPLRRVNDPGSPIALAHGAFILIRRSTLERVGGIASVRNEIVEDIRFAHRVKALGGRIRALAAPTLSQTHMYGSFADIWRGLRKNAFAGMDYQRHKYVTGAVLGLMMSWGPVLSTGIGLLGVWDCWSMTPPAALWVVFGLAAWLAQAVAVAPVVVYLGLPPVFAFSLPAGISAYVAITTASVWHFSRGRVLWKDRVLAAPRPSNREGV